MPSLEVLTQVSLPHYLTLSIILFMIGMIGVLLRKNILIILMSIELMLSAVNISFVAFSHFNNNVNGQVMVFFVMTVAAAEAGVGLALIVALFKRLKNVELVSLENLKG